MDTDPTPTTNPRNFDESRRADAKITNDPAEPGCVGITPVGSLAEQVNLAPLLSRPFAHRGLHSRQGPAENSLSAIEAAIDSGLGVEIDLQLSADGQAVLHHDATLERVCRVNRRVRDLTASQLLQQRLAYTDETLPLAEAAIDLVAGRVPLLLDLKCAPRRGERRQLARQIAELTRSYSGPVAVVGFDPFALAAVAKEAPWVLRGQSGGVPLEQRGLQWMATLTRPFDDLWFAPISRPHFVSYNVERISATSASRMRGRMPLVGWTLRCTHRLRELAGTLDQVIVEGPATASRNCQQIDLEHYDFGCIAA